MFYVYSINGIFINKFEIDVSKTNNIVKLKNSKSEEIIVNNYSFIKCY